MDNRTLKAPRCQRQEEGGVVIQGAVEARGRVAHGDHLGSVAVSNAPSNMQR